MSGGGPVVVFALNGATKEQFFPGFNPRELPAFREEWVDASRLNPGEWEKLLAAKRPEVVVTGWGTPAIPEGLVQSGELSLRYVCHLTGTVKGIVSRDLIGRGILVSNWGGVISHTIAEHALLLILGALRNMPRWRPHLEGAPTPASNPGRAIPTRSLRGRRVGIHGFGAIVRHLISLLKPFGVSISSYSAGVPVELFAGHGVRCCGSLDELVSGSDILVECEALTPQSKGSVDARVLSLLPNGAVFVNVGRGAVVDEAALARLAATGKITVALDVFVREPLPRDSPLLGIPDALLSPHIAGPTQDALPLCGEFALANLRHYLSGRPDQIKGLITLEIYDRTT
jgi:phosphoglycerate dehydrogenase-like enzyme